MSDYNEELTADQIGYLHELANETRQRWKDHEITTAIASELYKALQRLEADEHLLAAVGSWGDTATDKEFLQYLRDWNATGKVIQERQ